VISGLSQELEMLITYMDENLETIPPKILSEAAERALLEAAARRNLQSYYEPPTEVGGRKGQEPTRFGDWEKNGIAHDF
jgi:hypothetical protein